MAVRVWFRAGRMRGLGRLGRSFSNPGPPVNMRDLLIVRMRANTLGSGLKWAVAAGGRLESDRWGRS